MGSGRGRHWLFFSGPVKVFSEACFRSLAETALEWCLCYLSGFSVKMTSYKLAFSKG